MLINILILIVSIAGLAWGADILVAHSSNVAAHFKIKPYIIGATVVAFGTSMPEFTISNIAQIRGSTDIAIGNILGSNICNIGLILGVSFLISPIPVNKTSIKMDIPLIIGGSLLLFLMSLDGELSRLDGLILFTGIIWYTYYCVYSHKKSKEETILAEAFIEKKETKKIGKNFLLIMIGLALLTTSAHFATQSAVNIAHVLGITELFIGLTIVAIGTSLPEFATSTAAIIKKESDISVGNIVGSNIFNIFFILGFISIIKPIPVEKSLLSFEFPFMIGYAVLLYIMGRSGNKFGRLEGAILFILYCVFIGILYKYKLTAR